MPMVGLLNLPRSLGQQSVSLVPVADTTLHEAFPTNNFGGGSTFTSGGRNLGGRARALLKFDVAGSLPSGATLISASLTVTVTAANGPGSVFSLHRVGSNWGEGSGSDFGFGSPGGAGEATWNDRLGPGTPWATAGGDYVPALSASTFLNQPGQYAFTSPGLLNDLQLWLAQPGTNFGWLLRSEDEHIAGTIRRFGGRLHEDNPPRLQITFTVPVPAPVITNTLYTNGLIQFEFLARSNRAYRVETRASVTGGLWTTLTNFPAQPADTQWSFSTPATGPERYFRVATP
ncbi:MAG: DNRLRE domain-containing protein [Verrucomicrobiales bacterium]|nr:DNRLRE domain-containing protein [Verrucomicrobiales bacterium]